MPDPRQQWRLLLVALQAMTRLPVAAPYAPDLLRQATRFFPLAGLLVGALAAAVFLLAERGFPPVLAALLSLAATLLLTGALHEDGLADTCDGLFGGRTRADALRIMQDSRIGAFGALGLAVVVGVKLACLATLADPAQALLAAHGASRFWAILPAATLPYARPGGMAGTLAAPGPTEVLAAAACGLAPLLLLGARAVPALLLAAATTLSLTLWLRRRLAGYTGDTLGATQQLTEAATLLAATWHAA